MLIVPKKNLVGIEPPPIKDPHCLHNAFKQGKIALARQILEETPPTERASLFDCKIAGERSITSLSDHIDYHWLNGRQEIAGGLTLLLTEYGFRYTLPASSQDAVLRLMIHQSRKSSAELIPTPK